MRTFFRVLLSVAFFVSPAFGAPPPDATYVVSQKIGAGNRAVLELVELYASKSQARSFGAIGLPGAKLEQVTVLRQSMSATPIIVGIDSNAKGLVIVRPGQNYPVYQPHGMISVAVAEYNKDFFLMVDNQNAVFAMDPTGAMNMLASGGIMNRYAYGYIRRIQMVEAHVFMAVTDTHFLVVDVSKPNAANVLTAMPLSNAFQSNPTNPTRPEPIGMVADAQGAWLHLLLPSVWNPAASTSVAVYVDRAGKFDPNHSPMTGMGQATTDIELLDIHPATRDLYSRHQDHYVRYDRAAGKTVVESGGIFSNALLGAYGAILPVGSQLNIDQHRSALRWMPRAALTSLGQTFNGPALQAHTPIAQPAVVTPAVPVTLRSPVAPEKAADIAEQKPEPKRILEPVTAEEFRELIRTELGEIGLKTTTDEFIERVETAIKGSLRFYFYNLEPQELKALGLKRQMYNLVALPDRGRLWVDLAGICNALAVGRQREIKLKACSDPLLKP